jgi:hypothetical protein
VDVSAVFSIGVGVGGASAWVKLKPYEASEAGGMKDPAHVAVLSPLRGPRCLYKDNAAFHGCDCLSLGMRRASRR